VKREREPEKEWHKSVAMPRGRLYKKNIKELSSKTKINLVMSTEELKQKVFVLDVFAFVVLGNGHVATVGFQVVHLYGSVSVVLNGKGRVNHTRHVVLTAKKGKLLNINH
jgi:hypothetical protein